MNTNNENWNLSEEGCTRIFHFKTFSEAFAFMTRVALLAEKYNHHPKWSNLFREVKITLFTYDKNAITELDWKMSHKIDRIYQR